jgi:CSLREA domain-containing protein
MRPNATRRITRIPSVRARAIALAISAGLLALASMPAGAEAETFTVNKRADHTPGGCTAADCTLREAAFAATALDGDDKIKLPSRKPYRLTRPASLPGPDDAKGDLDVGTMFTIGNGLRIVHPGEGRATIDAAEAEDRAIQSLGSLRLIRLKVRGGEATLGGGVYGNGAILPRHSLITGNQATNGGGVYMVDGVLHARNSLLNGNQAQEGGGAFIHPDARLDLGKTTVRGNEATNGDGGGLWVGTATYADHVEASTIDHNSAAGDGGAIYTAADLLHVENATLTENFATGRGGGIYSSPDSGAFLRSVTIARNRADADDTGGPDLGGGIFADGGSVVVEMRNSLLAKNRIAAEAIEECHAPAPVGISSLGGNLLTSAAGCPFFDHPEDILAANPKLGSLAKNGGPTKTIALRSGSPAINQADGPFPPERDQRGHLRHNPDIGSFER